MADRPTLPPQVLEALRRGDKIAAIKILRAASKVGLAEAKGVIDALEAHAKSPQGRSPSSAPPSSPAVKHAVHAQRRPREDDLGPGEVPRGSLKPAAVAIALAAGAFAAWCLVKGGPA